MNDKQINQLIEWDNLQLGQADLDFIYNFLLEEEKPMLSKELSKAVINEHIRIYKKELMKKEKTLGQVYRPNHDYKIGEVVLFPIINNQNAKVTAIRDGRNPDVPSFKVVTFLFDDGIQKEYAGSLADHRLNTINYMANETPSLLDVDEIIRQFGKDIVKNVVSLLSQTDELFSLSDLWFPKALMAEINPGYLNLAEAVMEMEEGVPVTTKKILEAIEYPLDSNEALTEFSFNYAMHKDDRFDEVGSTGNVIWMLKLLEPEDVRKKPLTLKYFSRPDTGKKVDNISLSHLMIHDELDDNSLAVPDKESTTFDICINYPHWKAGTMPLIGAINSIFPTALETDKVIFEFYDRNKDLTFPGWVLIKDKYISGLKKWYRENHVIPGSIIRLSGRDENSIVEISLIPPHSSKDWVRTALFDKKGKLYFEVKQQPIHTEYDERMCIYVENNPQLDVIWEQYNKAGINFNHLLESVFKEISADNPQGIVHFLELYAGINMMHRCPPNELLMSLFESDHFEFLDDLYFRITSNETLQEV